MLSRITHAAMVVALTACATATSGAPKASRDANLITREEIATSMETNAYEVVARLRPLFLKSRGSTTFDQSAVTTAAVFVDGQPFGEIGSMRGISVNSVDHIRYVPGPDAVTKYGMQYGKGAIEVTTR
jgi:hypothetical protein